MVSNFRYSSFKEAHLKGKVTFFVAISVMLGDCLCHGETGDHVIFGVFGLCNFWSCHHFSHA